MTTERPNKELRDGGTTEPRVVFAESEVCALYWLAKGRSNHFTARKVGVSDGTIRNWRKNPAFAERLEELIAEGRERADRILRSAEPELVRALIDVSLGRKKAGMPRVAALRDALTRLGVGKPERLEVSGGLDEVSDEDLERAALARAAERGWSPPEDEEEGDE